MWTRKQIKEQAKAALGRNYWRIVLVALLITLLGGGLGVNYTYNAPSLVSTTDDTDVTVVNGEVSEFNLDRSFDRVDGVALFIAVIIVFIVMFVVLCIAFAVNYLFIAFLVNPLEVGVSRFMAKNVAQESETVKVAEAAFGFDHGYKNIVRTMFHRDLSVFLWALLFLIPGIYKKYQYRMVSYILTEYPDMPYREALERSKMIMEGEKWNAFVLDLSFFPWVLLTIISCGLVGVFYLEPYYQLTCGALYLELREKGWQQVERL